VVVKGHVPRMAVLHFPCWLVEEGVVEVWSWGSHLGSARLSTCAGEAPAFVVAETLLSFPRCILDSHVTQWNQKNEFCSAHTLVKEVWVSVGRPCCRALEDLGASQAGCELECLVKHVATEMTSRSIQLNVDANDTVARTIQAVGETSATRTEALGSGEVDSRRACYFVHPVLLDLAYATGRHLRQKQSLGYEDRATARENRSRESGDLEGRWESIATVCLLHAGSAHDGCSAVCHTALLVKEMAVVHLAHVCGCWTHSA
jgi:hypothetical protein